MIFNRSLLDHFKLHRVIGTILRSTSIVTLPILKLQRADFSQFIVADSPSTNKLRYFLDDKMYKACLWFSFSHRLIRGVNNHRLIFLLQQFRKFPILSLQFRPRSSRMLVYLNNTLKVLKSETDSSVYLVNPNNVLTG
jgi:hypothetical protein